MECISEECEKCGHVTKITALFENYTRRYYCKCNHPANKNWFTKLIWFLNGSPAKEIKQ